MTLGAHLPTSKGFKASLVNAVELRCDCLQIFSKSPRQWNAAPLDATVAAQFRDAWKQSGLGPLVAHDSYLINLAAPDPTIRAKSIAAMVDEVERADALGCDFLVTHCGAHLCKGSEQGLAAGLDCLAESLAEVHRQTPHARVRIALENTAGQGTCLGGPFEHMAQVLHQLDSERLAVCFDTCHAYANGHDVSTAGGLNATIESFDKIVGLNWLALVHLNDSKGELGRHLDRHEHIGQGQIGRQGMARIVNHPQLKHLPFILETPEVETMVATNLDTVRQLWKEGAGPH